MKLVTFQQGSGTPRLGALLGRQDVIDLEIGHIAMCGGEMPVLNDMQSLIEAGPGALDVARDVVEFVTSQRPQQALLDIDAVRLLSPLPRPVQMRDFLCFEQHLKQSFRAAAELRADQHTEQEGEEGQDRFRIPDVWYDQPIYYKCNRFSVVGTETDVLWPSYSNLMDYELEMAAVIGSKGKDISASNAKDHIFGYTIFNDFSARDAQTKEMAGQLGPAKGKDFDTGNVLGPCIVTADDIDPYDLTMVARVNGEEWSRGNSGTIHHTFEAMIAHVSQSETLYPGEVLGSGTVGNGCGLESKRFLSPGDVVELEVEGIGLLRNRIVKTS